MFYNSFPSNVKRGLTTLRRFLIKSWMYFAAPSMPKFYAMRCLVGLIPIGTAEDALVPDVSFWCARTNADGTPGAPCPYVAVDFIGNNLAEAYSEDAMRESFVLCRSLRERFVYNFDTGVWTCYRSLGPEVSKTVGSDRSMVLGQHLGEALIVNELPEVC